MKGLMRWAVGIFLAGAFGGMLVGSCEALLVTVTSGSAQEYWLFLFGAIAYGGFGVCLAIPSAIGWQIVRLGRADEGETAQVVAAVALGVPALAVSRYHVIQRVFGEEFVLFSTTGILTYALLLVGVALVALVALLGVRWCYRSGRRWIIPGVCIGLLAISLGVGVFGASPSADERARRPAAASADGRPNVNLGVADTLRADAIEPLGGAAGSTPHFARLGRDAVVFERAYSQASWTRPSIASILTSVYPSVHGAIHKMDVLPDRVFTLAEAMRAEGYWTAAFTTNINVSPVFNYQQGFDEFVYLEPSFYFWATDSATKLSIYKGLRVLHERFLGKRIYFPHYYQDADVLTKRVKGWLEGRPPEPFFLFVHYMDPHDPYFEIPYDGRGVARVTNPSPPVERAEALHKLYLGEVRYLDAQLGELLGDLRSLGLYDRSVLALTADHGEEFQDHGGWWHGTTLYQEAVHVPLFIKRSSESDGGGHRRDAVRSIDIAPTLMAAARLSSPTTFMGTDLFSGLVKEPLFAEEELEGNRLTSIRVGNWKLITANPGNPRGLAPVELYDLAADPDERVNLAEREPERAAALRARLESFR